MATGSERAAATSAARGVLLQDVPYRSRSREVLRRLLRHRAAIVGFGILVALVLVAVFAPIIAPYGPDEVSRDNLQPPNAQHLMGTDNFGRDIFSRVVFGARLSLQMGVIAVTIGAVSGTILGLVAGMNRGWTDHVIMRMIDALMAFPGILLALTIATILGVGLFNAMIAVGISSIPLYARLVRSSVLQVREMPYVEAARSIGCDGVRLVTRHVFPNVATSILILATLGIASAILIGASLSFLGLGAQPPTPEWGAMLNQGRQFMRRAWWVMTFPGLAITITVMAANLFGDGLRDALDPKMKV